MALVYPKTNPPVYQMVFTEPSIAVKKPLHHHFSRFFFIITVESGYQIPIFRQTAIYFIIVPLLTRVVNYPTFKGKEALPDEVPPSGHTSLGSCIEAVICRLKRI